MQNSPPPTSSGKVKFHAKAILLLFNYQLAPRRWSSPDRFSFVRQHKAREAGLGGLQGWGRTAARAAHGAASDIPSPPTVPCRDQEGDKAVVLRTQQLEVPGGRWGRVTRQLVRVSVSC